MRRGGCDCSRATIEINISIRDDVVRWLSMAAPVAFACEACEGEEFHAVWLSRLEFDELRGAGRCVVCADHAPRAQVPAAEVAVAG